MPFRGRNLGKQITQNFKVKSKKNKIKVKFLKVKIKKNLITKKNSKFCVLLFNKISTFNLKSQVKIRPVINDMPNFNHHDFQRLKFWETNDTKLQSKK